MSAAALAAATVMLAFAPARADRVFTAILSGSQNVPPIREVTATGSATLLLNDAQTQVSYHIEYDGLAGTEIASHIHNATPAQNGPIVFTLPPGNPKDGVWNLTPQDVTELIAGRLYVNIHSDQYLTGEIRGNLMEQIVPVEETTWGRVKALFATE
jgi:hypothetical protein